MAYDVVDGLLGADVLGFHCARWRDQFVDCCRSIIGKEPPSRMAIFPLSTEADELSARAHRRDVDSSVRQLRDVVGGRKVIGRVDRTELSKNV